MENNRRWLVYANESRCNHIKAFTEIGHVSWNPHNRKFKVGDIVYLFLSIDRCVRFKTKVSALDVPRTDQKYWSSTPLIFLPENLISLQSIRENFLMRGYGFKGGGSIEQPMCSNKEQLNYIEEIFTK